MSNKYSGLAMALHWIVAVLVAIMLVGGQSFEGASGADLRFGLAAHSSLGLTVLGLMILRVLWRVASPPPPLPAVMPGWQKLAAHAAHGALYALLIALPVTGLLTAAAHLEPVTPFGALDIRTVLAPLGVTDFDARRAVHELLTWILMGLLALHLAAAAYHQVVQGDNLIMRMIPGGRR